MRQNWAKDITKLNSTELAKLEKDGLEVINDIPGLIEQGVAALTPADLDRLKWLGLYLQRPKVEGHFMLRVKVPGGILNTRQAYALAGIAEDYGRKVVDITTRHSMQFHWLRLEHLPQVFAKLDAAGLTTLQAAGDCPRNIIASPLAGIDPEEFIDTTQIVKEVNDYFHNNRDFSNLPRKFKIAISGGLYNSVHAELNDLAFIPAEKMINGEVMKGFHVLVGGGLSAQPQLAAELDLFLRPEDVLKVSAAVAVLFRDYGYREKRNHARLKFLVSDWGKQRFTKEILKISGPLLSRGKTATKGWNAGKFLGIHRQKQDGFNYFGLSIPAGRLSADGLRDIAAFADQFGNGALRTANSQDIIIPNIADEKLAAIYLHELYVSQQKLQNSSISHSVVCTGKEFCPFAAVETKKLIGSITTYIDQQVSLEAPVRIHISGCPNSCGQPQIADFGLQGSVMVVDGKPREAFEIWVGGRLGPDGKLGTRLTGRVPVEKIHDTIVTLLRYYQENRLPAESFSSFVAREGWDRREIKFFQNLFPS
jgi:ferredoxin-nitrite reductase